MPRRLIARRSLRFRLMVILAMALTPILFIAAIQAYFDGKQSLVTRRDELVMVADRAIDDIETQLTTAESMLTIFAEQIAAGRCDDVYGWLSEEMPSLISVVFFDTEGVSQCTSVGEPGFTIQDAEWNDRLKNGTEVLRTDTFMGKSVRRPMIAVFRRLSYRGEYVGASSFGLSATKLAGLFQNAEALNEPDVKLALIDGQLSAFGDELPVLPNEKWVSEARNTAGGQLFIERGVAGDSIDVVISQVAERDLYAVVTRPSPGLFDELSVRPAVMVGLPLLSFSIALASAWFAVDGLVLKWLLRLRSLAFTYGRGEYDARPDQDFELAPEEISSLASAMDRMSERIGKRDADLKNAVKERDAALKEIHHRVKNNLQIVTSFLNLQSRRLTDAEGRAAINATRLRIDALSVVHQTLYQHDDLDVVHLGTFFEHLLSHLSNALGFEDQGIDLTYNIQDLPWRADDAIPLALFVLEAITNSTKYAFDEDGGEIHVELVEADDCVKLTIRDNGGGETSETGEPQNTGLGSKLMQAFERQLRGQMEVINEPGIGYTVRLTIPNRAQ